MKGLEQAGELVLQLGIIDVDARDIDRHGHRHAVGFLPLHDLPCRLAPDIVVQLLYQPVALEQRNELARADEAQLGMDPAHQRLGTRKARLIALDAVFGLVVDADIAVGDRLVDIADQALAEHRPLMLPGAVQLHLTDIVAADAVAGALGAVEPRLDHERAVCIGTDARAQPDAQGMGQLGQFMLDPCEHRGITLLMGAENHKGVRLGAAGDALDGQNDLADQLGDLCQNGVALFSSEQLVHQTKAVNIEDDGVGLAFDTRHQLADILKEELLGIQTGDRVLLDRADDALVLGKLDDALAPRQYHLGHAEGLGDKVRRAHADALYLGALFGGHHDDGRLLEGAVAAAIFEKFKAAHPRHDQVEQDQGILAGGGCEDVERFAPVVGIGDKIILRKKIPEYLTVDDLVVDDQDVAF